MFNAANKREFSKLKEKAANEIKWDSASQIGSKGVHPMRRMPHANQRKNVHHAINGHQVSYGLIIKWKACKKKK